MQMHKTYMYNVTLNLFSGSAPTTSSSLRPKSSSNESFVLLLPGRQLDVSSLVNKRKKFRNRGGRDGALLAMKKLEENGLGKLVVKQSKGSVKVSVKFVSIVSCYSFSLFQQTWIFHKVDVPEDEQGKSALAKVLGENYNISLLQYMQTLNEL